MWEESHDALCSHIFFVVKRGRLHCIVAILVALIGPFLLVILVIARYRRPLIPPRGIHAARRKLTGRHVNANGAHTEASSFFHRSRPQIGKEETPRIAQDGKSGFYMDQQYHVVHNAQQVRKPARPPSPASHDRLVTPALLQALLLAGR